VSGLNKIPCLWLQILATCRLPHCSSRDEKSKVTLRPTVSRPVCLGVRRPSGTRDQFFFLLEIFFKQLRDCYFVAPFLTRGRVCNLLLLLVLASTFPRDSRPYFIAPILEIPQPGAAGPRIYVLQEQMKLKLKLIYDGQSVGQSVLVSGVHLGTLTNFSFSLKFPSDSCVFVIL
jgi:hypothetical protein